MKSTHHKGWIWQQCDSPEDCKLVINRGDLYNFFWPGWFQAHFVITNHPTFFFFWPKTPFDPPYKGSEKMDPHYMAKNENHLGGSCDSVNKAFWCTDCNAKKTSALYKVLFLKKWEKLKKQNTFFVAKMPIFYGFSKFFRNATL